MKRIGILMPAITDLLQGELIHSVCESAFPLGFDVVTLTNATNGYDDFVHNEFSVGEENIFSLLKELRPEGVIFPVQFFHKTALIEQLCDLIAECGIPCVTTGQKLRDFLFAEAPQRIAMAELTEHLITSHGCKRIICLTGPKGIPMQRRGWLVCSMPQNSTESKFRRRIFCTATSGRTAHLPLPTGSAPAKPRCPML